MRCWVPPRRSRTRRVTITSSRSRRACTPPVTMKCRPMSMRPGRAQAEPSIVGTSSEWAQLPSSPMGAAWGAAAATATACWCQHNNNNSSQPQLNTYLQQQSHALPWCVCVFVRFCCLTSGLPGKKATFPSGNSATPFLPPPHSPPKPPTLACHLPACPPAGPRRTSPRCSLSVL